MIFNLFKPKPKETAVKIYLIRRKPDAKPNPSYRYGLVGLINNSKYFELGYKTKHEALKYLGAMESKDTYIIDTNVRDIHEILPYS